VAEVFRVVFSVQSFFSLSSSFLRTTPFGSCLFFEYLDLGLAQERPQLGFLSLFDELEPFPLPDALWVGSFPCRLVGPDQSGCGRCRVLPLPGLSEDLFDLESLKLTGVLLAQRVLSLFCRPDYADILRLFQIPGSR